MSDGTKQMREEAGRMISGIIGKVLPGSAVKKALQNYADNRPVRVLAVGKAAFEMAGAAQEVLQENISHGLVITKYGHSKGEIKGFDILEAAHQVPNENSVLGARKAMEMVREAGEGERILLLISGGGSSLMEMPEEGLSLEDIQAVTGKLLGCGASIQEINRIRKRLSAVKGGKLAALCPQAEIHQIVLSDIIDDDLEQIASGPACEDTTTNETVREILRKYRISFPPPVMEKLFRETPKHINNVTSEIIGSVRELCRSAADFAGESGYRPLILSTGMDCEAREAGRFISSVARTVYTGGGKEDTLHTLKPPCALIFGGETVVTVRGEGKGGRNQEMALSVALGIDGMENVVFFSIGSDGTDGPTDAAGGMVDGATASRIREKGLSPERLLEENDSYHGLKCAGDLVVTGPTGTNVNDVAVLLCRD